MKTATPLPRPGRLADTAFPAHRPGDLCHHAMGRLLAVPREPLFFADWDRTLMLHYEIDPAILRPFVPFPLDLHAGKAYVTLVAFTLRGMRPRRGGRLAKWLMGPIATHGFLNVRTYVRVGEETGIYFITEYMNHLLALKLGPVAFGLPYRFARLDYRHDWARGTLTGRATDLRNRVAFAYEAMIAPAARFAPAPAGTLTEWLMERYTAFTVRRGVRLLFRVWHPPWANVPVEATVRDDALLRKHLPWFAHARYIGANFAPGVTDVWMGRPHRVAA
ncbi:MAG: DUF2071 domain-containing protein [Lacunisphaera sp.]